MLGEKIGEIKSTAVTKVLPANGSKPRFETNLLDPDFL